ncbi:acyltransferase [Bradyrhizobium manausense]|uniref:acyltransferase family protein n=1 Tax=Bradyrhizobium manausense TaxID=989370 RepID=UPI001BA8CFE3|nr:acyltransferase [Bradyrhizobium manausense]MBR1092288.1 acyltransferase [Bradyrhizobium manausense]
MLANVQALRALAALMVVYVHCELLIPSIRQVWPFVGDVREAFGSGVDLFFIISGFIMVYTTGLKHSGPVAFFAHRIARIVPLYWLLTLCTFVLALILPSVLAHTTASLSGFVKSLLFIPYTRGDGTMRPVLFLGWTLNYEMFFYVLFALGLFVREPVPRLVAVASLIVAMVTFGVVFREYLSAPLRFITRPIILEFIPGMILGLIYPRLPNSQRATRLAMVALPCGFIALILAAHLNNSVWPLTAIPATGLMVAALVLERAGVSATGDSLQLIGAASYSLYLSHPFVTQGVSKLAASSGLLASSLASAILIILAYGLSIIAGIAIYRFIERPLSTRARRLLESNRIKSGARN